MLACQTRWICGARLSSRRAPAQRSSGLAAALHGAGSLTERLQGFADRLDPVGGAMLVDERVQDFSRRSNSTWAKTRSPASRSLTWRSSLFSRSRSFTRWALGRRDTFTHPGIDLHPLATFQQRLRHAADLRHIDSTAAHNDGYSPRCSCTFLTARSRASGENCSTSSRLNPLRGLSLLKTRGGSLSVTGGPWFCQRFDHQLGRLGGSE